MKVHWQQAIAESIEDQCLYRGVRGGSGGTSSALTGEQI
jgi:hypothetical protein